MNPAPAHHHVRVLANRRVCEGTIELEIERGAFRFVAGQEIILHGEVAEEDRTYSIASGEHDATMKLLVRIIPDGAVSTRLARMRPRDSVRFSGPTGSFTLRDPATPCWFIATGTGIAPLVSFIRTQPALRPVVLHGVRHESELYARALIESSSERYEPCISRPGAGAGRRVTDALRTMTPDPAAHYYLCGGNPMIREVRALLLAGGVAADRIFGEAYYFW